MFSFMYIHRCTCKNKINERFLCPLLARELQVPKRINVIRNSTLRVSFRCFSRLTLKCTYHVQRVLFKHSATLFVCVVCVLGPVLGTDTPRALFCQYSPLIIEGLLERDVLGFTNRLLKTATKSSEETVYL